MRIESKTDLDRYNRTKSRQAKQKEYTKLCEYSVDNYEGALKEKHYYSVSEEENGVYHLISEGVTTNAKGEPYDIIGKNVLKDWYDNLDENVVYDIDLQHDESNPLFRQIGTWSKKDLKLVQNEDGRYSLYTKLNLDDDSIVVKELKRKNSHLGLSVEFYSTGRMVEFQKKSLYLHETVNIVGFGIVGESGDAYSGNVQLVNEKEAENHMKTNEFLNSFKGIFGVKSKNPIEEKAVATPTVEEKEEKAVDTTTVEEKEEKAVEESTEEKEEKAVEISEDVANAILDTLKTIGSKLNDHDEALKILKKEIEKTSDNLDKMNKFTISNNAKTSAEYGSKDKIKHGEVTRNITI